MFCTEWMAKSMPYANWMSNRCRSCGTLVTFLLFKYYSPPEFHLLQLCSTSNYSLISLHYLILSKNHCCQITWFYMTVFSNFRGFWNTRSTALLHKVRMRHPVSVASTTRKQEDFYWILDKYERSTPSLIEPKLRPLFLHSSDRTGPTSSILSTRT